MMGTDVVVRGTLDLTRAPDEQWNDEMVAVVAKNVFRGKEITKSQLHYCLAVADGLALNPMIGEIYFLPSKSRNAEGPAWTPYIGRNGLVNKAETNGCYFESDTVHELDKFRYTRRKDGTVEVTHSYGMERGEIVGAYAFLHDVDGRRKPAFFYAKLAEYLPSYDADWKMQASPWGNQRSAMIEKCAMIGAGRKRLRLGNVLADGEIARVQQMQEVGPGTPAAAIDASSEMVWENIDAPAELVERLQEAVQRIEEISPLSWPTAKLEMMLGGMPIEKVISRIEQEIEAFGGSEPETVAGEPVPAPEATSEAGQGGGEGSPVESGSGPEIADASVVDEEKVAALRRRAGELEAMLADTMLEDPRPIEEELAIVERELAAAEDPAQMRLG